MNPKSIHFRWSHGVVVPCLSTLLWGMAFVLGTGAGATVRAAQTTCPTVLHHTHPRLQDEKPQALCQYAGQVVLVVNTRGPGPFLLAFGSRAAREFGRARAEQGLPPLPPPGTPPSGQD